MGTQDTRRVRRLGESESESKTIDDVIPLGCNEALAILRQNQRAFVDLMAEGRSIGSHAVIYRGQPNG